MHDYNEEDFIVKLLDDDGNEVEYVLLDSIEYDGHTYVYLVPKEQVELEEQDLYIMEYIENEDGVVFETIENEILLNELFNEYLATLDDEEIEEDEEN